MNSAQSIHEGANDRMIGMLARECMEAIKGRQEKYVTSFPFWSSSVKFTFYHRVLQDFNGLRQGGYYIPKEWQGKRGKDSIVVSLEIGVPRGYDIKQLYEKINWALRNTIAHELEHAAQMRDRHRAQIDIESVKQYGGTVSVEYLTDPAEIAAFSRGIYMEAKTRKIPFSDIARETAEAMQSASQESGRRFDDTEREKIIKTWEAWAKANLPKAIIYDDVYESVNGRSMKYVKTFESFVNEG